MPATKIYIDIHHHHKHVHLCKGGLYQWEYPTGLCRETIFCLLLSLHM